MRAKLTARFSLLAATCAALPTLLACLDHPLKAVAYEGSVEDTESIQIAANRDVDVLFVIDDSSSMGREQGNLSANFGSFVRVLEEAEANYRIAVTTTDNGNPQCNSSIEGGNFVLSSCRSRLNDFQAKTVQEDTIDESTACTDFCEFESLEVLPTTTSKDSEPRPREWVESREGVTNLPEGVSATAAMQCFGPQGVSGCGIESPLESMRLALSRAAEPSESEYGFLRDHAILSIVFVTDEADCSFNKANQEIFKETDGEDLSALCWDSGVTCDWDGLDADQCTVADFDVNGNRTSDPGSSVLYPVDTYISAVQDVEDAKKRLQFDQEVLVSAIVGVASDYPDTQSIVYREPGDEPSAFEAEFGVQPGCTSEVADAVPPVRLRAFAERFLDADGNNNLFSVCDTDYSSALSSIARSIEEQIRPPCMNACVADTDEIEDGLQPLCTLVETYPTSDGRGQVNRELPLCETSADGSDLVPEGVEVCHVPLVEDQMSQACREQGWNLEFRIVRREGALTPSGSQVNATCELSTNRGMDCPDLPS